MQSVGTSFPISKYIISSKTISSFEISFLREFLITVVFVDAKNDSLSIIFLDVIS